MSAKTAFHEWEERPIHVEQAMTLCPEAGVAGEKRVRVLAIDDDETVLDLMKNMLAVLGFDVEVAMDGYQGLETFSRERFDVVITDFAMPRMNGCQLAQKVKEISPDTPVVVVTGYAREDVRIMADAGLFRSVLQKPFSLYALRRTIDGVL